MKNTVILLNFLVWTFSGKTDFENRPKLCGNCAFPQNVHTRKLGEITVFFAVLHTVRVTRNVTKLRKEKFPPAIKHLL